MALNEAPHDCYYPKAQAKLYLCEGCYHALNCSKKRTLPMPKYKFRWTKKGIYDENGKRV